MTKSLAVPQAVYSIALLCVAGCSGTDAASKKNAAGKPAPLVITSAQAIRFAEEFIRANGYTNDPPENLRDLDLDLPDEMTDEDAEVLSLLLAERRNSIKPCAYGWKRGRRNDPNGWTVGFELVKPLKNDPSIGQAVEMDDHGSELWVELTGFDLKSLSNKL